MPIVFICGGVLNLLLLFDKFNFKNIYKKTLYIIFLFLIQISYFSFYVKFNDISFNFLQSILFFVLLILSFYKSKFDYKILIFSILSACTYEYVLTNFFDNVMVYSYSNVCFLFALIIPIFISDFYRAQSLLFLNLIFLIGSNLNYEMTKYTFAIIDFDFCFQIILIFLILRLSNYLLMLNFFNASKFSFIREFKNEKNCFVTFNNYFYLFDIN